MCDLVSCEEKSENLRDETALLTGGGSIECYECAATVVNGPPLFLWGFLVFFSIESNISYFNLVRIVYKSCMLFWLLSFFTLNCTG